MMNIDPVVTVRFGDTERVVTTLAELFDVCSRLEPSVFCTVELDCDGATIGLTLDD